MADDSDKTEEPTSKKLSEAKDKGQIGKSQDLEYGLKLFIMTLTLLFFGASTRLKMGDYMVRAFGRVSVFQFSDLNMIRLLQAEAYFMLKILFPFLVIFLVFGVLFGGMQTGFIFSTKKLVPDFKKVFSLNGLKQIISPNSLVELIKGVSKIAIVGSLMFFIIRKHYEEFLYMGQMEIQTMLGLTFEIAFEMSWKIAVALIVLGFFDLMYQKHRTKKQLMMSKQEVKDEHKNAEGDPKIKAKIRSIMYQMHQKMMSSEVPKATVVITNPTFIAIAIRYDRGKDEVPIVVAKGKRLMAEKIRNLATENQIPLVENKPLARAMFDQIEVGQAVPTEFFNAVAEVLAYVFSMQKN
jgi:flagellar biosynthetic protein FlhB